MVSGKSRAVLYAAIRDSAPLGDRTADVMVGASRRLGMEFAIRDEVDRRLQLLQAAAATTADGMSSEEIRGVHAELRSVAQTVTDTDLQTKLRGLSQRLANLLRPTADAESDVTLTPREVDVLSQVALGCTNIEAGQRLSPSPGNNQELSAKRDGKAGRELTPRSRGDRPEVGTAPLTGQ